MPSFYSNIEFQHLMPTISIGLTKMSEGALILVAKQINEYATLSKPWDLQYFKVVRDEILSRKSPQLKEAEESLTKKFLAKCKQSHQPPQKPLSQQHKEAPITTPYKSASSSPVISSSTPAPLDPLVEKNRVFAATLRLWRSTLSEFEQLGCNVTDGLEEIRKFEEKMISPEFSIDTYAEHYLAKPPRGLTRLQNQIRQLISYGFTFKITAEGRLTVIEFSLNQADVIATAIAKQPALSQKLEPLKKMRTVLYSIRFNVHFARLLFERAQLPDNMELARPDTYPKNPPESILPTLIEFIINGLDFPQLKLALKTLKFANEVKTLLSQKGVSGEHEISEEMKAKFSQEIARLSEEISKMRESPITQDILDDIETKTKTVIKKLHEILSDYYLVMELTLPPNAPLTLFALIVQVFSDEDYQDNLAKPWTSVLQDMKDKLDSTIG